MAVDFVGVPTSGAPPLTVNFTDMTTPTPSTWDWDYGDLTPHGNTQNPSHAYSATGSYDVTLSVAYPNYWSGMDCYNIGIDPATGYIYYGDLSAPTYLLKCLWNTYQEKLYDYSAVNAYSAARWDSVLGDGIFLAGSAGRVYKFMADGSGYALVFTCTGGGGLNSACNGIAVLGANLVWGEALYPVLRQYRLFTRAGVQTDYWNIAASASTCTAFADGRLVLVFGGTVYVYSGWKGVLQASKAVGVPTGTYVWCDHDDATNTVYVSYVSGATGKVCQWNITTDVLTTYTDPTPARQVCYYNGWAYYRLGVRYNFGTSTQETWDGSTSDSTTKLGYITSLGNWPQMSEQMRHLKWFRSGVRKSCYLGWR